MMIGAINNAPIGEVRIVQGHFIRKNCWEENASKTVWDTKILLQLIRI